MRTREQFRSMRAVNSLGQKMALQVGNHGSVLLGGERVKTFVNADGYEFAVIPAQVLAISSHAQIYKSVIPVHRLVAEAWCENPDPDAFTEIDHVDSRRSHNTARNLRWVTKRFNLSRLHARRAMAAGHAGDAPRFAHRDEFILLADKGRFARFATARDAAKWLQVSTTYVYRRIARGRRIRGFSAQWQRKPRNLRADLPCHFALPQS